MFIEKQYTFFILHTVRVSTINKGHRFSLFYLAYANRQQICSNKPCFPNAFCFPFFSSEPESQSVKIDGGQNIFFPVQKKNTKSPIHARHNGDIVQRKLFKANFLFPKNTTLGLAGVNQNFKSNFLSFKYFFGSQNLHN